VYCIVGNILLPYESVDETCDFIEAQTCLLPFHAIACTLTGACICGCSGGVLDLALDLCDAPIDVSPYISLCSFMRLLYHPVYSSFVAMWNSKGL